LGGTILVVEDNPVNLEVALGMLEMLGCSVETAQNGRKALETLSQGSFDAILMDCQMPEMDGFEATREIRRREQLVGSSRRLPIIALTANAMKGDRERCLATGMDDFLSKPFQRNQLRQVLQRHLERHSTNAQQKAADSVDATPGDNAAAILDVAVLDEIRALQSPGRPNILHKVINHYIEDTPKLLASLHEALAKGDAQALQLTAHSLKSSSANVGAVQLSSLSNELETRGRENDIKDAEQLLTGIESSYVMIKERLESEFLAPGDRSFRFTSK
jgi:CheY-like chemotaxis protein/HPt (histidine-containing phosphotransfer) domain-containing protein